MNHQRCIDYFHHTLNYLVKLVDCKSSNSTISAERLFQSGGSFNGVVRRASRSPSPASGRERSRSVDQNGHLAYFSTDGPLVDLSDDRTPSNDSLDSNSTRNSISSSYGNGITLPSPGSSSSPRSPISPSWNHNGTEDIMQTSVEGNLCS